MKKLFTSLSVALVLLAGSLVTSCDLAKEIANELAGPTDTWCEMYVEYGSNDKQVNLTVDAIYVDEQFKGTGDKTSKVKRNQLSPEITLEPGITFVVTLHGDSENQVIQGLTHSTYLIKHFDKNTAIETNDDTDGSTGKISFKGSKTNWNLLYYAKSDLRNVDNQFQLPEAPDILTYTSVNDGAQPVNNPEGFSWSKLLKQYLLTSLLDKIE